jgi:cation diffusion facilitator family transporter
MDLRSPLVCTRLSLVFNVFLFFLKITAGIFGRSQALVADALNSLLDIVANIVVWLGIKIAQKPPDKDHPYGHGNADTLAAVFVALILIVTGGYIGREAVESILTGTFQSPTLLATGAALLTIVIKGILYKYTISVGRESRSQAVMANARDHISDVVVSAGTLVGIVVAQIKYPILDPIAGIWVALFIVRQAVRIIKENLHTLMVGSPDIKLQKEIIDHIKAIDNVAGIKWVKGRIVGAGSFIDAAIQVSGKISVHEGHLIAHKIRSSILENFPHVADILIHIEPDTE